jgi:hypothetical protein
MSQAMLASRRLLRHWTRVTAHVNVTQDREEKKKRLQIYTHTEGLDPTRRRQQAARGEAKQGEVWRGLGKGEGVDRVKPNWSPSYTPGVAPCSQTGLRPWA